ncbi:MAG: indolepyruvate oxidoreductase subunit beta [Desulfobacteraceae bacterium]|nr:indolepyruvate oxidoreductase subunit beta [Desulfobacteraceae bacterium]
MSNAKLSHDPYNLIIAGVGGQGNVLASKLLGQTLLRKGLFVTIGESFGGNQRGGSVSSHMRISSDSTYSPLVPYNAAHAVVGLEATETFRILAEYGNPEVKVICNTRPIHSVGVISGESKYPKAKEIRDWMQDLSAQCWFLDATDEAMKLGSPIYGNIFMIGALAGIGELPLDRKEFKVVISEIMTPDKIEVNLKAFDLGKAMVS